MMSVFGWVSIIVLLIAIIGFLFIVFKRDPLDGTRWTASFNDEKITITFNKPNFTLASVNTFSGPYTLSGNMLTMKVANENTTMIGTLTRDILVVSSDGRTVKFVRHK